MEHRTPSAEPPLILLVDDEEDFATVTAKRLARRGLRVETALSGEQALRLARALPFDLAVLDLKMEGMDGLETLKILKTLLPEIKIIMLTGHGSAEMASQGLALGAYDYLTKPCELSLLLSKIQQALAEA
jgi:CheY-like chemotaxis protein